VKTTGTVSSAQSPAVKLGVPTSTISSFAAQREASSTATESLTTETFTSTTQSTSIFITDGHTTTSVTQIVSTSVTTMPVSTNGTSSSHHSDTALIGGIVGGIVFLVLLTLGICFFFRRRYRSRSIVFTDATPYANLDGNQSPRALPVRDVERSPSLLFNPMAMVASSSSRSVTPPEATVATGVPFQDFVNDGNATIKRTLSSSRVSRADSQSSFSSRSTDTASTRSSSSFVSAQDSSDRDSIASTITPESINPFADPPTKPMALNPFADPVSLPKAVPIVPDSDAVRILPGLPQGPQLRPPKPLFANDGTRLSQASVDSSHWGVAV